jgi:hypothetical protein
VIRRALFATFVLLAPSSGCSREKSTTSPPALCGLGTTDWCPSPAGDPCGDHKDRTSCMADARCKGMPYRGESAVACHFDAREFADNCPTVGCVSR